MHARVPHLPATWPHLLPAGPFARCRKERRGPQVLTGGGPPEADCNARQRQMSARGLGSACSCLGTPRGVRGRDTLMCDRHSTRAPHTFLSDCVSFAFCPPVVSGLSALSQAQRRSPRETGPCPGAGTLPKGQTIPCLSAAQNSDSPEALACPGQPH